VGGGEKGDKAYNQRPWKPSSIKVVSVPNRRRREVVGEGGADDDGDDDDVCGEQYYSVKLGGGHARMKSVRRRPDEIKRKEFSNQKRDMQRGGGK